MKFFMLPNSGNVKSIDLEKYICFNVSDMVENMRIRGYNVQKYPLNTALMFELVEDGYLK